MTHRTRTLLASASAAVLVGSLAACSGNPTPDARPSTNSTQDSASASASPSPTHTPTPKQPQKPVLPDEAKPATRAGAEAFGEYFWDVLNYTYFTGDTSVLRTVSMPTCEACVAVAEAIDGEHEDGNHYEGSKFRFRSSTFLAKPSRDGSFSGKTVAYAGRQVLVRPGKAQDTSYQAGVVTSTITMFITDGGWKISYLESVQK